MGGVYISREREWEPIGIVVEDGPDVLVVRNGDAEVSRILCGVCIPLGPFPDHRANVTLRMEVEVTPHNDVVMICRAPEHQMSKRIRKYQSSHIVSLSLPLSLFLSLPPWVVC